MTSLTSFQPSGRVSVATGLLAHDWDYPNGWKNLTPSHRRLTSEGRDGHLRRAKFQGRCGSESAVVFLGAMAATETHPNSA